MKIAILIVMLATLALGALGIVASDLTWPLPHEALIPLSLYALALVTGMGVLLLLVAVLANQGRQQRNLLESLDALGSQQRSMETAQLMERFVHQAELLLEKDSLDPNKRSVQRCLAVDAMRGNTGRGDPNYHRLGRLFEWLADEADEAKVDHAQMRLIDPVLRQYAEVAEQLCRIGEADEGRLAAFLRFQPQPPTPSEALAQ